MGSGRAIEIRPSWLHSMLRKPPGSVPAWALSSTGRTADAVDYFTHFLLFLPAILFSWFEVTAKYQWFAAGAIVPVYFVVYIAIEHARTVERMARVRINRGGI